MAIALLATALAVSFLGWTTQIQPAVDQAKAAGATEAEVREKSAAANVEIQKSRERTGESGA